MPEEARIILVYTRKEQKNTLTICEHLRNSPENSATPILLAISRYEIPQGNAVKRMGNAAFIMTPFGEKELRDTIHNLLGKS